MAKVTKKEKKEAKKAALTLVETEKHVNTEVKPEESTEEGDPEPATEEKTEAIIPRIENVAVKPLPEKIADAEAAKGEKLTVKEFSAAAAGHARECSNVETENKVIDAINEIAAEEAEYEALDLFVSSLPKSLTIEQSAGIADIHKSHGKEEAERVAKNLDETNKEIAIANEKIEADRLAREEKAIAFKKYVEGDLEIPGDLDDEAKAAIVQAQKHLPRNIMCQGSHAFCSINEMSKDKPRYSINFLKKKGLIK